VFSWDSIAHVGTISINAPEIFPEWFGATGDGATDDSIAFYAAAKTGRVNLANAGNYLLGPLWGSTPTPLTINGGTVTLGTGKTLGNGILALDATKISGSGAGWFTGTAFQAFDSEFSTVPSVASSSVSGCKVGTMFPFYAGTKPTIWGAYTDIPNAQILGTNSSGKIEARGTDLNLGKVGLASLFFSEWLTTPTLTGTVALTNPLNLVYMVDNTSPGVDITLPPIGSGSNPNFLILIPTGSNTITIHGTMMWAGTPVSSNTFNKPLLIYVDYGTNVWYILSLN